MEIIDEVDIPLADVKKILMAKEKAYKAEGREMLYEQRRALEHAKHALKLNFRDTHLLMKKLMELGLELTDEQIVKICDLLPETVDDVRAIFAKERFKYDEDSIKKILDTIAQYR